MPSAHQSTALLWPRAWKSQSQTMYGSQDFTKVNFLNMYKSDFYTWPQEFSHSDNEHEEPG